MIKWLQSYHNNLLLRLGAEQNCLLCSSTLCCNWVLLPTPTCNTWGQWLDSFRNGLSWLVLLVGSPNNRCIRPEVAECIYSIYLWLWYKMHWLLCSIHNLSCRGHCVLCNMAQSSLRPICTISILLLFTLILIHVLGCDYLWIVVILADLSHHWHLSCSLSLRTQPPLGLHTHKYMVIGCSIDDSLVAAFLFQMKVPRWLLESRGAPSISAYFQVLPLFGSILCPPHPSCTVSIVYGSRK